VLVRSQVRKRSPAAVLGVVVAKVQRWRRSRDRVSTPASQGRDFATCSGPPSHCRPSAQDKASWRGQTSTAVDGSSQFERSFKKRSVSKTALILPVCLRKRTSRSIHPSHRWQWRQIEHFGALGGCQRPIQLVERSTARRIQCASALHWITLRQPARAIGSRSLTAITESFAAVDAPVTWLRSNGT
jgi:hypothetical protein